MFPKRFIAGLLLFTVAVAACSDKTGITSPHYRIDAQLLTISPVPGKDGGEAKFATTVNDPQNYTTGTHVDLERRHGNVWRTEYFLNIGFSEQRVASITKAKNDTFHTADAIYLAAPMRLKFPKLAEGQYRVVAKVSRDELDAPQPMSEQTWSFEFDVEN